MDAAAAPAAAEVPGQGAAVLDLHVARLQQLFNSMDPAPFRERDLDPAAQSYIVEWAGEQRPRQPLRLVVHVDAVEPGDDVENLSAAVQEYFRQRERASRHRLRKLLRTGRISLVIGLAFLAFAFGIGESIASLFSKQRYATLVQESLVIGGWVALWRPLEIFLYDWWPIVSEARLYARLGAIEVRLLRPAAAAAGEGA